MRELEIFLLIAFGSSNLAIESEFNFFYPICNTCIESFRSTSVGTRLKCYGSLQNIELRFGSWCIYMCIVFFIISMKQMFRPILLSCVLYICFILFSNRLIDEHSRDHYRELTFSNRGNNAKIHFLKHVHALCTYTLLEKACIFLMCMLEKISVFLAYSTRVSLYKGSLKLMASNCY